MHNEELTALFDKQAHHYDKQWERMAAIRDGLHFLLESVFADLPKDARILCVGVGTGAEVVHLARHFPEWRFTVIEPAGAMLAICRQRAEAAGCASRCYFHEGYLDSLPNQGVHDAATCFLVSQFIVEQAARTAFFRQISDRLKPGGILANADLSAAVDSANFEALLRVWQRVMSPADISAEALNRMRAAYAQDVAVVSPAVLGSVIQSAGFEAPVQFFQAGLMHAWFAMRSHHRI